jgi:hypothetical protein
VFEEIGLPRKIDVTPDANTTDRKAPVDAHAPHVVGDCVVRAECLDAAMVDADLEGFWGGTSARERAQLRGHAS